MDDLKEEDISASTDKTTEINRTYVISAVRKYGGQSNGVTPKSRLTLQKRKTGSRGQGTSEQSALENAENRTEVSEKRLTLQRRTRTGSIDKSLSDTGKLCEARLLHRSKILSEPNNRTPSGLTPMRSGSLRETGPKTSTKEIINALYTPRKNTDRITRCAPTPASEKPGKVDSAKTDNQDKTFSTPTRQTQFEKISVKKDVFERLASKDHTKSVMSKSSGLEKQKPAPQLNLQHAHASASNRKLPLGNQNRGLTPFSRSTQVRQHPSLINSAQSEVLSSTPNTATGDTTATSESASRQKTQQTVDTLKMENSAVTVAVRARPFNSREKNGNAHPVIFMHDQETVVQHPETKQTYTFSFDFSFCSIDETDSKFASQQTVYEKLARPLLERAFEGFNTCLFAYGQTGSGKSYTMMGFGEEAGVTPRFCEELFTRLSQSDNKKVSFQLEMSYFEVYNEKIHDLLVAKEDHNQKKLPLRVREHPVHGPYVADLSTNVVSSYADIQGWLELGNKQRATAATGMNDKSSRSHSVFTLIMTQTTTECVEGEEHDHRITSRINLIDLAGSERCTTAQTSGDRLREGASINKSLLTLGKVISALSEQVQTRKKLFIPYRESVLTWLLKESLGGNSKTAMIATLSPAASNVDESLSTLRYAQQARMIINIAKVNEDTNAKLIRELKAEVEKLRSAQMSSQGIEPEKMRLFQQEIAALKMQLTQQEREMAEVHRAWKEKLEQAERRKLEETKELQRAGVTFKVDNRLPNLVNLNEDPQLSEMLLYMIREGQTKVGKRKSESAHDIQLSGALIADEHCVISNVNGTVSITPMKNAKTFVNGHLISESTVLHHGDRVILGGDHYFRFNHPVEVQSGKRVSCWAGAGDGQKDFEFAKNELLSAQRAQLEAEIEEARLKAKQEMMQEIQVAKEMAQEELTNQKQEYENKIKALEQELEEETGRNRVQELNRQRVASQMEELQTAKTLLEQQVHTHQKRLHMEAQATRQAMADHAIRHAKILQALEAEKRKIAEDLAKIQRKQSQKEKPTPKSVSPQWDTMKLSLMIEEANKISEKFRKHTVFSRHEVTDDENGGAGGKLMVQVQNTKLGISTLWSLEKFHNNVAAMRELEQGDDVSKDDDVFYDPNDEWEPDISTSSTSALSRRRSRSLLKSRRISGRLYEIRVHPIQSLNNGSSQASGLMGGSKPPSVHASTSDSALPGICKDLIGACVAQLRGCQPIEESLADKLISDLLFTHSTVRAISDLYEQLDDDCSENLFASSVEAQSHLVRVTSAIERAVFLTVHWLSDMKPNTGQTVPATAEDLKTEVKKVGGYFQLLIQGCDSDISSMVTEAVNKIGRCLDTALSIISHLAAVTGTELHQTELSPDAVGRRPAAVSLLEGYRRGVHCLLEEGLCVCKLMLKDTQLAQPRTQVLQSVKMKTLEVACAVQSYIHCNMSERQDSSKDSEADVDASQLREVRNTATRLLQLNQALQRLHSLLSQTLRGRGSDVGLPPVREAIQSSSRTIAEVITGLPRQTGVNLDATLQLPCVKSVVSAHDDVHTALQSLTALFDQSGAGRRGSSGSESGSTKSENHAPGHSGRNRTAPKIVYTLTSGVTMTSRDIRWV
ncbi:LOW QUALITY PROTEIN: kinesin-like protein KIF14 [Chanos chanos]|uniref:Kinesin-like protein KIF14 n=1 Tax=Chanos chanos TaxID=29144 RepID=A0A6J2WBV5_CHACN|nr:LOW QUALITY PROTEIN: kinesin-like protein KIF14 [Chanos chanos]